MHLLILGAAGMLGRKLAERVAATGAIGGVAVDRMTLADVIAPDVAADFGGTRAVIRTDLSEPGAAEALVADRPDVVVHLAAIVSADAEANFDTGYRINLDGTRALFEAVRHAGGPPPRVVYASSVAVFGAPFPDRIPDDFQLTPRTSYGVQKAMAELLLDDYSRKGFLDGVGIRFPTICIRPGSPTRRPSGFFSGILREPLNGQEAVLPVPRDTRHWFASPRAAVGFIERAATMSTAALGHRRNLSMPGVSATVGDQIDALRRVAGDEAVALIREVPDPIIQNIVAGWARDFDAARARDLGFEAEGSFDEIIRIYIEDELGGGRSTPIAERGSVRGTA
jgi:nucleoside-diphosphate-sugar epimerase